MLVLDWETLRCILFCILVVNAALGISQTLPIKEEFSGSSLNTNIWTTYNSDSAFSVQNGKLYYLTTATTNIDNDSVLILKNPISLTNSWEASFWIFSGTTPVVNPSLNSQNNAFRKFGFIFVDPNNTNLLRSFKFYDQGTTEFPYMEYEARFYLSSNQPTTIRGTNQLTLYPYQTNSNFPYLSKVSVTWTAPKLQLKIKIEDPNNSPSVGLEGFQIFGLEAGDVFSDGVYGSATNVMLGIIMKSAYQSCELIDNFSIERVHVSEGMDINLLGTSNLAAPLSAWGTNDILTLPKNENRGFFKITPK